MGGRGDGAGEFGVEGRSGSGSGGGGGWGEVQLGVLNHAESTTFKIEIVRKDSKFSSVMKKKRIFSIGLTSSAQHVDNAEAEF